jgi:hypothetical protein
MSSYGTVTHTLASAVADDGTVAIAYPTGQTRATLRGATGGDLTVNDGALGRYEQADPGFSASFGASTITITNLSGLSWPAGSKIVVSFGDTPASGSYNLVQGSTKEKAQAGYPSAQELTASGAVDSGVKHLKLNHATVVVAATMVATEHPGLFTVVDTSASGTAAHTVTLTGGTWNGTNTIATLNAPAEALIVFFDENGLGTIVSNIGSVALSG